MPYRRLSLFAALLFCLSFAHAQDSSWVPKGMDALAERATFHTDFTFDKSMLEAASQMMPAEDRPIIAKLRSISVHSFRYSAPGLYDAAALEAVRAQFGDHGWKHMVTKQTHVAPPAAATGTAPAPAPGAVEPPRPSDPTRTDLWVRWSHDQVEGMVLLVANEKNVNLVTIDGTISPLDLMHLRGHFGIPRFHGDDFEDQQ